MGARSIGKASISFGLVSIPVKFYTTNESSNNVYFNMLHDKDGGRLKQQYTCTKCNEEVGRDHTHKGYEYTKGQYVTFTTDELKALDVAPSETLALEEFVPAATVDPLYVEKSYYLAPDKGAERAYRLIRDAMIETGLVGVARYAVRGSEQIVCLRPYREGLMVHQLRYQADVKAWSEIPVPDLPEPKDGEMDLAKMLIGQLTQDTYTPERYQDEVKQRLRKIIDQKIEGQEIVVAQVPTPQGQIVDLMEALKQSLTKAAPKAETPKKGRRRRKAS